MQFRVLTSLTILLAALGMVAGSALAQSAQVIVTPKVGYRIQYDDNLNNTKDGDVEHRLRPALQVDVNTEQSKNRLEASVSLYRLHDNDNLDRTEQDYSLSSRNQLHERVRLDVNGSYETDYTINKVAEELAETTRKTGRRRFNGSTRLEFVVTERNLVGLNYGFGTTMYDRDDFVDYDVHNYSADWTHIWTERFRTRLGVGGTWYDNEYTDGDGEYTDQSLTAGFEYDIDEIWTWSFTGGYVRSNTQVDRPALQVDKDGDGYIGSTRLAWDYPRSDGYVEYSRDNTVGLNGETLTRDRFRLWEKYLLSERSHLRFEALMTLAQSDGTIRDRDSVYYRLRPTYEYALDEHWTWEVGYSYELVEDRKADTSYDRNKVFMGIRWQMPDEW